MLVFYQLKYEFASYFIIINLDIENIKQKDTSAIDTQEDHINYNLIGLSFGIVQFVSVVIGKLKANTKVSNKYVLQEVLS